MGRWPTQVVQPEETWALAAWREVLAHARDPHPFARPEWQRAWWDHFGGGELCVLPLKTGERIVAVAALEHDGEGTVRFLGDEDLCDYPGAALADGCAADAAEMLLRRLREHRARWRELDVRNARPEEGFADGLRIAAERAGFFTTEEEDEPVAVLMLPASWEDYLASLDAHPRRELRRKQRRLVRDLPETTVRTAGPRTLDADLDTFVALHRLARGRKGSFMSARNVQFFRRVAIDFAANGMLRLDVLEHRRRPLAATFAFQGPRTFYLYNMAFDPVVGSLSPGIVLLGRLIERAIDDGLERFDFLRGLERYKLEFGATAHRLRRVRVRVRPE
jgi:CelD/BcsL family acetyltransferase involved in cellulose biosynthesis